MKDLISIINEALDKIDNKPEIKDPIISFMEKHTDDYDVDFFLFMLAFLHLLEDYQIKTAQAKGYEDIKHKKEYLDEMIENMKKSYQAQKNKSPKMLFPVSLPKGPDKTI